MFHKDEEDSAASPGGVASAPGVVTSGDVVLTPSAATSLAADAGAGSLQVVPMQPSTLRVSGITSLQEGSAQPTPDSVPAEPGAQPAAMAALSSVNANRLQVVRE